MTGALGRDKRLPGILPPLGLLEAHNGMLLPDELPEFPRQPPENLGAMIARLGLTLTFPARFMLVAVVNPCPGGH